MAEGVVLDPPAVAGARRQFDLTRFIGEAGPDWGDAAIDVFLADHVVGAVPVDYRVPNRMVGLPLNLLDFGAVTFEQLRQAVQEATGLWQDQGGWLMREVDDRPLYLDVVSARLKLGGSTLQALYGIDTDAVLELETLPDWYGDEIELDQISLATGDITQVLRQLGATAKVGGNFPRGNRCRIQVIDASGVNQRSLIGAFRRRHYDSATTAALTYEAEALTPLDTAAVATVTGANPASRNVVRHSSLGANWTPILSTNLLVGNAFMTHTGSYRVLARVHSTRGKSVRLRFIYDVGDLTFPSELASVTIPDASKWYIADLGEVRLDQMPVGPHRWVGQVQGRGVLGGEDVSVDRVWLVPVDEFASFSTAQPAALARGLAPYTARDEFNQSAGALAGKTLPVGGTWSGAGDPVDFAVDTATLTALRTEPSDSVAFNGGRFALASATAGMADQAASVDMLWGLQDSGVMGGLVLRYVDVNNWVMLNWQINILCLIKMVAGVATFIPLNGADSFTSGPITGIVATSVNPQGVFQRMTMAISADGTVYGTMGPGDFVVHRFTASDPALATGGTLARGSAGFYDQRTNGIANNRYYNNFSCWVPPSDAAIFASRMAEMRTDGHFRQDSTGTAFGPMSSTLGNLPRLPSSGAADDPVELFLKWSRGDLGLIPDAALDVASARIFYRPCYLFTPDQFPGS